MAEIVLATLNARYHHAAFGLRYLHANLGDLQARSTMLEFTIQQSPLEIVETILAANPRIVGLGVYIWNVTETERVVAALKRLRPDVIVILGGPEVSYETDEQRICQLADYVITGDGDVAFRALCAELLSPSEPGRVAPVLSSDEKTGATRPGSHRVIAAPLPDLSRLVLPYELYTDEDLAHRVVYVEASRGCPFECEFCLSALDIPVRQFPLDAFLAAMQRLLDRGCRTFKFVDRTFNLNLRTSRAILEFFLARHSPGLFLHFELIPDRLPDALKELIVQFPAGALQFEVGIQTFNDDVGKLISRKQDNALVEQNLHWLREQTGVHVHADLIVGLPGETVDSFAAGFDRLVALGPQEIQVGILKRLRGTPIIRHDAEWQMVYSPHPPYEILQNRLIDFATMQELRRLAKTWDVVANSGNFVETLPWLWGGDGSPFAEFRRFAAWLFAQTGQTHGVALPRLVELVFRFLTEVRRVSPDEVAPVIYRDYLRGGRSDVPRCLQSHLPERQRSLPLSLPARQLKRQRRHQMNRES
ncbi:MAG: DUF4080 domain-containing protein [Planctomycetaceae bacterium]|nr:DUF4080 domain-containing protein [Planctomycetaceae bacterium]